jgi:hypothetical protein
MPKPSIAILACALALAPSAALRAEPGVISLARAYLGPESTLDGITSIHYSGVLEIVNPEKAGNETVRGTLDMVFVKPMRQRLVIRQEKLSRTTVLDGYDAWDYVQDNTDPTKVRLSWLAVADIKTLRASTWENLNFFRSREEGVAVEDKGPATIDGIVCERVDFGHGTDVVYQRFFDRDTGRLVLTVRGPETIRESGEIRVDGLRFAKTIVSDTKTPAGKDIVATVTFDRIVLNEPTGPGMFAAPAVVPSGPAGPSAGTPVK